MHYNYADFIRFLFICFIFNPYLFSSRYVIYQTLETVSHRDIQTEKRVENTMRSGEFLLKFEVFE